MSVAPGTVFGLQFVAVLQRPPVTLVQRISAPGPDVVVTRTKKIALKRLENEARESATVFIKSKMIQFVEPSFVLPRPCHKGSLTFKLKRSSRKCIVFIATFCTLCHETTCI